jgi:hypothetical protein
VEPVELVVELLGGRRDILRIRRRVAPLARSNVQPCPQRCGPARDLAAGAYRPGPARRPGLAQVEQLALDRGRHDPDDGRLARSAEDLPREEAGAVDREEHAAQPTAPHRLDVYALRENGHLSPTDQRHVPALLEHGLAHGQQDDHHAHADREAEQEKERPDAPDAEMPEGEREKHQSRMVPSSM